MQKLFNDEMGKSEGKQRETTHERLGGGRGGEGGVEEERIPQNHLMAIKSLVGKEGVWEYLLRLNLSII